MGELDFFRGKRVLVTGHTGFKGSWLSEILLLAGAEVTGYAASPPTDPALFFMLGQVSCFSLFFHDLFRIVAPLYTGKEHSDFASRIYQIIALIYDKMIDFGP